MHTVEALEAARIQDENSRLRVHGNAQSPELSAQVVNDKKRIRVSAPKRMINPLGSVQRLYSC